MNDHALAITKTCATAARSYGPKTVVRFRGIANAMSSASCGGVLRMFPRE